MGCRGWWRRRRWSLSLLGVNVENGQGCIRSGWSLGIEKESSKIGATSFAREVREPDEEDSKSDDEMEDDDEDD